MDVVDVHVARLLSLRQKVATVALEHEDACTCTICRAAVGDVSAFMALLYVLDIEGKSWVDVRLHRDDVGRAIAALRLPQREVTFLVERHQVSSSPQLEWELQIEDLTEKEVSETLKAAEIECLAIRERSGRD